MDFAVSRILVPVDFSPHSELALRYAMALASRLGASLELLHVVEDPVAAGAWGSEIPAPDLSDIRKKWIDNAERRLKPYQAVAKDSRVPTVTTVRVGPPAQAITAYAKAGGTNLIVMGTHGRSGLAHVFMGSVAERVVRHGPCPVLTLRETATVGTAAPPFTREPAVLGSALGHHGTSRE